MRTLSIFGNKRVARIFVAHMATMALTSAGLRRGLRRPPKMVATATEIQFAVSLKPRFPAIWTFLPFAAWHDLFSLNENCYAYR
jgi:hypothetical protein